ncbi:MAG TPA: hypothetical protein H9736_05010 [Candidatus Anaerotruncus excrementipullorum]|uniref:Uncharacterized protein n=1 Tax=Candidatus Anaerotruncus excrementipullorum TaxID=2838465 RepID=A0A9D2B774_9FIRM|nr:hypothetical protein [Candidatus Anaerotruncus excrementipullorum]
MHQRLLCGLLAACLTLTACQAQESSSQQQSAPPAVSEPSQPESASPSLPTQEEPEEEADPAASGVISGQVYRNDALGFSYTFPENWTLFDAEQTLALQLEKAKAAYGDTQALEESIALGSLGYLLYAQAQPHAAAAEASSTAAQEGEEPPASPANLLLQAAPAVALRDLTPAAYLEELALQAQETYENLGGKMEFSPAEALTVDGHEVALLQSQVTLEADPSGLEGGTITVHQGYSVFLAEDWLVIGLLSAQGEADMAEGMSILQEVSFSS